jgi:hypothetical protein
VQVARHRSDPKALLLAHRVQDWFEGVQLAYLALPAADLQLSLDVIFIICAFLGERAAAVFCARVEDAVVLQLQYY